MQNPESPGRRAVDPSLRPSPAGVVPEAGAEAEYADDQADDKGGHVAPVEGLGSGYEEGQRDEGQDDEDKRRRRDESVIISRHFPLLSLDSNHRL